MREMVGGLRALFVERKGTGCPQISQIFEHYELVRGGAVPWRALRIFFLLIHFQLSG
jgi:hypothetical protein